ncbi:hypothetical protein LTR66_005882 [Elasticomyces elasticus]|nr:hypothetical protein LTR66_005882 [Elasticomyces elasticus]
MAAAPAVTAPNPLDFFAVQNVIAQYCFALDGKRFDALAQVFTADVDASYPFPGGRLKGCEAVQEAIRGRLGRITTQHALTTQCINIDPGAKSAHARTYFTATHFGREERAGEVLTAYGTYVDELVCVECHVEGVGLGRRWMISQREVRFTARVGDERVMDGK